MNHPAPPVASHEQPLPMRLRSLAEQVKRFGQLANYDGHVHATLYEAAAALAAPVVAPAEPMAWLDPTFDAKKGYHGSCLSPVTTYRVAGWIPLAPVSQGEQPALAQLAPHDPMAEYMPNTRARIAAARAQLAPIGDERIREIWIDQEGFHPDPVKFARALFAEAVHPSPAPKDGVRVPDGGRDAEG